jgi:hypothetical protein
LLNLAKMDLNNTVVGRHFGKLGVKDLPHQ